MLKFVYFGTLSLSAGASQISEAEASEVDFRGDKIQKANDTLGLTGFPVVVGARGSLGWAGGGQGWVRGGQGQPGVPQVHLLGHGEGLEG